jgi:hypothetical protein
LATIRKCSGGGGGGGGGLGWSEQRPQRSVRFEFRTDILNEKGTKGVMGILQPDCGSNNSSFTALFFSTTFAVRKVFNVACSTKSKE